MSVLQRLEENSKRLEEIAKAETKKIDMLAERLTDDKSKRQKLEKKEVEQYLSYLKKKKTDDGEDIIAFD